MATPSPPRAYRAPCPGCGAPVDFASAQSTHAVCAYCQSTVVRSGEILSRLGKMAELFDDHSPLQLQASGSWQGQAFTLVGRLQYKYAEGTWTEWHAVRTDGTSAFLSEDNGGYVFTTPLLAQQAIPVAAQFRVGASIALHGQTFRVASNQAVSLLSAQGELPHLPTQGAPFAMVELRNTAGEILSIDYGTQPPSLSLGKSVLLDDLQPTGLRSTSVKEENGRQFNCPSCGAPVAVQLASSKSITCGSCHSLIDLETGIGGALRHATQDEPVRPLIPLGARGKLQGVDWQVVGFQHRMGSVPGDDEQFGWEEYLLFNLQRGFAFLVDSSEGWSMVKPTTGAPEMAASGTSASYLGSRYTFKESYTAETTYVLGEFYWQVQRGQTTRNRDFSSGKSLLSLEQTEQEVTWSVGSQIDSALVATAFQLKDHKDLLQRSDAAPLSGGLNIGKIFMAIFILMVLMAILLPNNCDPQRENCSSSSSGSSYRSSGGSYGGSSSGGGHK